MGLNLFRKSTVCQVLMQTFKGFYKCTKQPADLGQVGVLFLIIDKIKSLISIIIKAGITRN